MMHGFFQSVGGPVGTSIMGNWFSSKNRGYIFGTWTCHQYIGNITAAIVSSAVVSIFMLDYTVSLLIPAVLTILCGLLCMFYLPESPQDVFGIVEGTKMFSVEDDIHAMTGTSSNTNNTATISNNRESTPLLNRSAMSTTTNSTTSTPTPPTGTATATPTTQDHITLIAVAADRTHLKPISITDAIKIPNVLGYAMAFGFFKLVNYAMFFWLPYFLSLHYSPSQSNLISILYDIGMMPGGIIVGYVSDALDGRRACIIALFMAILVPLLYIFSAFSDTLSPMLLLVILGCMGVLIGKFKLIYMDM